MAKIVIIIEDVEDRKISVTSKTEYVIEVPSDVTPACRVAMLVLDAVDSHCSVVSEEPKDEAQACKHRYYLCDIGGRQQQVCRKCGKYAAGTEDEWLPEKGIDDENTVADA